VAPGTRLTDTQVSEGLEMLDFICRVRETHLGKTHIATGEVMYTEALVMMDAGRDAGAIPLLEGAQAIFVEHLVRPQLTPHARSATHTLTICHRYCREKTILPLLTCGN
jgi:hypothetical protein